MKRNWQLLCGLLTAFTASAAFGDDAGSCVVKQGFIPGRLTTVVVAEGDFEPLSVKSYSVRAHSAADPRFPFDDFIAGTVQRRDGILENIVFFDMNGDRSPEIIVVTRTAGSGGQLSADAFQLRRSTLAILGSVSGLARDANPVRALQIKLARPAQRHS